MARKGSVDTVSNVVGKLLSKLEKKQSSRQGQLFSRWEEIAGETIAEHVRPEKIAHKKLFLTVDSSVWLFELNTRRKEEIVQRITRLLGKNVIEDIVLKVDSF